MVTADGKTLLAKLRKWEGSSGLPARDVGKLITTASNPAQAQATRAPGHGYGQCQCPAEL